MKFDFPSLNTIQGQGLPRRNENKSFLYKTVFREKTPHWHRQRKTRYVNNRLVTSLTFSYIKSKAKQDEKNL